jgi:DNA-binding XRE family transcriptional regulator
MANTVSENIRKLRIKKGMSQDRLSKEADIALNTVVKIETGESPNPTVTLEKIAKARCSVADLFNNAKTILRKPKIQTLPSKLFDLLAELPKPG